MTSPVLKSYDNLKAAGFSEDQTRAILDAMTGDLVTRDYFDVRLRAELAGLKNELLVVMLGSLGLVLGSIYFVLPRLIHA
jgi:hypothetical protein